MGNTNQPHPVTPRRQVSQNLATRQPADDTETSIDNIPFLGVPAGPDDAAAYNALLDQARAAAASPISESVAPHGRSAAVHSDVSAVTDSTLEHQSLEPSERSKQALKVSVDSGTDIGSVRFPNYPTETTLSDDEDGPIMIRGDERIQQSARRIQHGAQTYLVESVDLAPRRGARSRSVSRPFQQTQSTSNVLRPRDHSQSATRDVSSAGISYENYQLGAREPCGQVRNASVAESTITQIPYSNGNFSPKISRPAAHEKSDLEAQQQPARESWLTRNFRDDSDRIRFRDYLKAGVCGWRMYFVVLVPVGIFLIMLMIAILVGTN